jgi:hypothetical protein
VGSSVDLNCDKQTGKCECLPNIIGQKCDRPAFGYYLPSMHQFKYELEDGYSNQKRDKNVRYEFDESVFPEFSWKGYVHLNKAIGEVSQDISIKEPGTSRMIVRYSNKNSNLNELLIRVKPKNGKGDEQSQSVYLAPAQDPKFETDTAKLIEFYTKNGYRDINIISDSVWVNDNKTVSLKLKLEEGQKYHFGNITVFTCIALENQLLLQLVALMSKSSLMFCF